MLLALKNLHSKLPGIPRNSLPYFTKFIIILTIFGLGIFTGYSLYIKQSPQVAQSKQDKHVSFILETYDKINKEYWEDLSEGQLVRIYKQHIERLTGRQHNLSNAKELAKNPANSLPQSVGASLNMEGTSVNDLKSLDLGTEKKPSVSDQRQTFEQLLLEVFKDIEQGKKKDFSVQLVSSVLSSLQPSGRSGLYTQKLETDLKNTVSNINPDKDLYKDLGLNKGASEQQVQESYQKKEEELKKDDSPKAQEELKKIAYAKDVLIDTDKKKNYDTKGVEPTTASRLLTPNIAYLKFDKFSPTTYEEFLKIVASYDKEGGPKALIFDLRGNIGGAIDALPFFLGNFLGDKQYIYDFMKKGELEPYKSVGNKLAGLGRMRQVVILVDNLTQSSAELLTAALKRYHFGVVLGVPTKGWGTVEKVFPLDNQIEEGEKYSLFLVHSITLRDDNQPIEGRGVEPDINIKDVTWEQKLMEYFRYPELTSAVKELL